ncbi:MAG: hypothetical protein FWG05_03840 [Kiritimatiellaeota bacterium]|nr:hypothetical protein [Kiritimatiellota bacterium]
MIRKLLVSLAAVAVAFTIGCEKSGGNGDGGGGGSSGGGGGNNSAAVGVWKCSKYDAPG